MPTIVTVDGIEKEIRTTDFGITEREPGAVQKRDSDSMEVHGDLELRGMKKTIQADHCLARRAADLDN